MKVGIIGATGYSGEWLVRLLARHPRVTLSLVASRSQAGKRLADVMPVVASGVGDLTFVASEPDELAANKDVDLFFLALPHGVASEFAVPLIEAGKQVIDLSADFRLGSTALYQEYYGVEHGAPALLESAPYVLPEIADLENPDWRKSKLIACPGCYPTSVQLPLYPLLKGGVISDKGIIINSLSGVSGAGRKSTEYFSFSERVSSVVAYGSPKHRHVSEIEEQLGCFNGSPVIVQFTPHLIPVHAGIATTIVVPAIKGISELYAAWEAAYPEGKTPFVRILPTGTFPETKYVVSTNQCMMSAVKDERTGNFVITSVIDNLIKGASGQAVQIMNHWMGWDSKEGLL